MCIIRIVVSHVHYFSLVNTEFHLPFYCPLSMEGCFCNSSYSAWDLTILYCFVASANKVLLKLQWREMSSPFCFFKYQWREYSDFELCKYFINSGKPKSEINKPRSHLHYKELLYRRNWLQHRSPRHSYYSSALGHSTGPSVGFSCPTCCH